MKNYSNNKLTGIYLLFLLIFISCNNTNDIPQDLVAQVNDRYLIKDMLNASVPGDLPAETKLSLKKMLIKKWVEDEIVYQSALQEGLNLDEREEFLLESYKKSLLIQKYLDGKLNKNYKISQKEIELYYDENKKEFIREEEEVHIIHLLIENRDNAIFREIGESNDLMEIIKKYYFDTRSTYESPNDDLGYVKTNSLPSVIQNKLRRMKTGSISNPLKTENGYHFIQLLDKQAKGTQREIEIVKDEITRRLKWQKREQEFIRLMDELKVKFQVQTYLSKVQ